MLRTTNDSILDTYSTNEPKQYFKTWCIDSALNAYSRITNSQKLFYLGRTCQPSVSIDAAIAVLFLDVEVTSILLPSKCDMICRKLLWLSFVSDYK